MASVAALAKNIYTLEKQSVGTIPGSGSEDGWWVARAV